MGEPARRDLPARRNGLRDGGLHGAPRHLLQENCETSARSLRGQTRSSGSRIKRCVFISGHLVKRTCGWRAAGKSQETSCVQHSPSAGHSSQMSVGGSEERRGRSAPPQAREEEEEEGGKRGAVSRVDSAAVVSELRN